MEASRVADPPFPFERKTRLEGESGQLSPDLVGFIYMRLRPASNEAIHLTSLIPISLFPSQHLPQVLDLLQVSAFSSITSLVVFQMILAQPCSVAKPAIGKLWLLPYVINTCHVY